MAMGRGRSGHAPSFREPHMRACGTGGSRMTAARTTKDDGQITMIKSA
jgi:hypothetical protein